MGGGKYFTTCYEESEIKTDLSQTNARHMLCFIPETTKDINLFPSVISSTLCYGVGNKLSLHEYFSPPKMACLSAW